MSAIERTTPAGLPPGWRREVVIRKSGQSAGKYDVYYFSPDGKKFRSKPQIVRYLGESVDLNLFDFSGRSTVGGQRRSAKDRPPKRDMYGGGRLQERPLSNTPMRPAGPIRRTCGVIKLPVMYYPVRSASSSTQIITTGDAQVVLGSGVQQLWVRRLSPLQPIDSMSGETISADPPPLLPENNLTDAPSEQPIPAAQLPDCLNGSNINLPTGANSLKSPPINPQYSGSIQNSNLVAAGQQSSLPNHYSTANNIDINATSAVVSVVKSHTNSVVAPVTSLPIQPTSNAIPVYTRPTAPQLQNGQQQGLLLQPNNVVYMQLQSQPGKTANLLTSSTKVANLQMVQQLPAQSQNHSLITETDIRLQEQKVQLLRQQLGLTS